MSGDEIDEQPGSAGVRGDTGSVTAAIQSEEMQFGCQTGPKPGGRPASAAKHFLVMGLPTQFLRGEDLEFGHNVVFLMRLGGKKSTSLLEVFEDRCAEKTRSTPLRIIENPAGRACLRQQDQGHRVTLMKKDGVTGIVVGLQASIIQEHVLLPIATVRTVATPGRATCRSRYDVRMRTGLLPGWLIAVNQIVAQRVAVSIRQSFLHEP